jgi:WD40 repeat protein
MLKIAAIILFFCACLSSAFAQAEKYPLQRGDTGTISELGWSPDSELLLSASGEDNALRLWNVSSGKVLWTNNVGFLQDELESYSIHTSTMFLRLPAGGKINGLCPNREISIWFGLEDRNGESLPYGFDSGSESILLPKNSALFAVPRAVLRDGNAIRFAFTFLKVAEGNKIVDYGNAKILKFRETDLPAK